MMCRLPSLVRFGAASAVLLLCVPSLAQPSPSAAPPDKVVSEPAMPLGETESATKKNADAAASADDTPSASASTEEADKVWNLPFEVRLDPLPVPFGQPFDVVVTVTRKKGQRLRLPGVIPSNDEVSSIGPARRKLLGPVPNPNAAPTPVPGAEAQPPKKGEEADVKTGQKIPPVIEFLREEIRIPFIALALEELKTPELVLTDPDGRILELPSMDFEVATPEEPAPPTPGTPGATDAAAGPSFARSASAMSFAVDDPRPRMLLYSFLTCLFCGLLFGFVHRRLRYMIRFREGTAEASPEPEAPAHVTALARLEGLMQEGHLERGEVALFVPRLMDEVLRHYLEKRFDVDAEAGTTRELCEDLLRVTAEGLDVGKIKEILSTADLIKFARADASVAAAHQMAGHIRALIERTQRQAPEGGSA